MEANEILKGLRESRGLTMKEVSEATQMATSLISDYETGKKILGMKVAIRFADYYNVSLDYLLGREPCNDPIEQLPVGEQDRAIVQAYINLSDKERSEFVEILRKIAAGAEIKMVISHEHKESEIYISKTAARNGEPPGEKIRTQEEIDEIRSRPDADPDL